MTTYFQEKLRSSLSHSNYLQLKQRVNHIRGLLHGSNLNQLASIHGTDKWNDHWYTQHYQHQFGPWRTRKLRLLEIGIGGYEDPFKGGDSLRLWKSFFPNADIHELDIIDKTAHQESRITVHVGSQVDFDFLQSVIDKYGPFNIIIDDGSHINAHVRETFNFLFPKALTENGIYVIEDTQTSYWENFGGDQTDLKNPNTMMNLFKELIDKVNCQDYLWNPDLASPFDYSIISMHFYHNLVFLYIRRSAQRKELSNYIQVKFPKPRFVE